MRLTVRSDEPPRPTTLDRFDELRPTLHGLPLPGSGATLDRWRALARIGAQDLSLARLAEGHADAVAIMIELDRPDLLEVCGLARLGVWAADPGGLRAERRGQGWHLSGSKPWCSGSLDLDHALITATAADGPRLFLVATEAPSMSAVAGSWDPMGMRPTRSETLVLDVDLSDEAALGSPHAYVERAGFGHGGAGVAACWWGGAVGVVEGLRRATATKDGDELATALGESIADLEGAWASLATAAASIDEEPLDTELSVRTAAQVRLVVEAAARRVLARTVEALGSAALCHQPDHATRVADLTVYLSQLRRRSAAASYGRTLAHDEGWIPW